MRITYILYSPTIDRFYIGYTQDLTLRLEQHRAGRTRTTSRVSDWVVAYAYSHGTQDQAILMERSLKAKKSRASLRRFIEDPRNEISPPSSLPWREER